MWVGHYLLGIGYYVVMSIAVWVEGTGLHPMRVGRVIDKADRDGLPQLRLTSLISQSQVSTISSGPPQRNLSSESYSLSWLPVCSMIATFTWLH